MTKAEPKAGAGAPAPASAPGAFEYDTCLYRGVGGEEARVFRKDEPIPAESEGWHKHPSLCPTTKGE